MRTNPYVRFLASGCEGRAYCTIETPSGLLSAILQALEFHGHKRADIEKRVDIKALEAQLNAVDESAFRTLLHYDHYHPLQTILTATEERIPAGSAGPTRDRGTIFGASR